MQPGEVKKRIALAEQELAALKAELTRTPPGQQRTELTEDISHLLAQISMLKASLLAEASPLDILTGLRQQEGRVLSLQGQLRRAKSASEQAELQHRMRQAMRSLTETVVAARHRLTVDDQPPAASYPDGVPDGDLEGSSGSASVDSESLSTSSEASAPEGSASASLSDDQPSVMAWPVADFPAKSSFSPYFLLALSGLGTWLFFTRSRR